MGGTMDDLFLRTIDADTRDGARHTVVKENVREAVGIVQHQVRSLGMEGDKSSVGTDGGRVGEAITLSANTAGANAGSGAG